MPVEHAAGIQASNLMQEQSSVAGSFFRLGCLNKLLHPMQATLLGLVYLVDRAWARRGLLPSWYMRLRLPLTLGAAGGLMVTAMGSV